MVSSSLNGGKPMFFGGSSLGMEPIVE
jgi:hypothetical protein